MEKTVIKSDVNDIIYVEPNYINSTEQYDVNGLNTYEFTPPLEDYSIFVNLEVETRGRNVQSSKTSNGKKIIMSFVSNTDGTSAVNFMQGSKIPIGENGATINSLTTNYTDIFLRDLKQNGSSTELFGIESIDIAYNSYMVPEVTIEFVDVRGVALFAQKEAFETEKNIDDAINSNNKTDIANTFFQCFFTFPYPKFTLLIKGFYGQPVSYELTCADFRARFDSRTGNFACTAKFVGYHFSFLNDVMMNGVVAAPYSDYIGAAYWENRQFKLKGLEGGLVDLPKIGHLLSKMKEIIAMANRVKQSDPVTQEKTALDQKNAHYESIEQAYREYSNEIDKFVKMKEPSEKYNGESIVIRTFTQQQDIRSLLLLSPTENEDIFSEYIEDDNNAIENKYKQLEEAINKFNQDFPNNNLPKPIKIFENKPSQRIFNMANSETNAQIESKVNNDIKESDKQLYNKFSVIVKNGNRSAKRNPILDYKNVYYYSDNRFSNTLEKYKKETAKDLKDVEEKLEKIEDESISKALGWRPTVENITKIIMAHFETFARMIFETSKTICDQDPPRTIASLKINDIRDVTDVSNKTKSSDIVVPPFPRVATEVKRDNTTLREETWVGDYKGDFREKDLVHGIINGVNEVSKDILKYENPDEAGNSNGSETPTSTKMRIPLSPLDMISTEKTYISGGFDQNDVSSVLGLVALRVIQIIGTTSFSGWGDKSEVLGRAEACNFLLDNNISNELGKKLSTLNEDDVFKMLIGDDSGAIKKPGGGNKPWPWRVNGDGGIIDSNGNLAICKVKNNSFALPYQNLGWDKIKNEIVHSPEGIKAIWSNDYINGKSYGNVNKENIFTVDTNVNRFSNIVEEQLTNVVEGLDYYKNKFLEHCKYVSSAYTHYLTNKADEVIAYIIENAANMIPSDESCMLPTSKKYFANKSFGGGYEMNDFHKENPGEGGTKWIDKDGNDVKRKSANGYAEYLNSLNYTDFAFTEFPGVKPNLEPFTVQQLTRYDIGTSIFAQELYYRESDKRARAMLFLASLGYVIDYKKVVNDFICEPLKPMGIIPLPAVMFIGGLLWSNTNEGKGAIKAYNIGHYVSELNLLQEKLRKDVQRRFINIFKKWVTNGVENDSLLRSFEDIRKGMELKLIRLGDSYDAYKKFFGKIGEQEDKGILRFKLFDTTWYKHFEGASYNSISEFLVGELSDDFFRNYITIDEDVYGGTSDGTRGMRLGIRDGGPSSMHASNFALAGCLFSKNVRYFVGDGSNVTVGPGVLKQFFKGFLDIVKKQDYNSQTSVSEQISQAIDPDNTNTDIKIGIYRYCKMIYDKWIAGLSDEEFEEQWTIKAFFENNDKYFHFIDAYYNVVDFIPTNIGDFCDKIVSCYRNDQYSLLSFLSSVYAKNKFNFLCVQNFIDLGKRENMKTMFDTVPYTDTWEVKRHPNFIVMYPYESSNYLADVDNSEYDNDGFMLNQPNSEDNRWPEPLTSRNANSDKIRYNIPAFGVSYGKMYQSYFRDVDISMDNPTVTEQSIKAQFAIACQNNEGEQSGDRSQVYTYGQDLYSIYSNNSYTCNVTMMGCAWVQPLMYFVLSNIPMFRGTYLIEKVSHHIEPGNMLTKFMGVRMSNVCTRIARHDAVRARNNQTGEGEENGDSVENRNNGSLASIDNDCPYKEYPLDGSGGNVGNLADLNTLQLKKTEMENAKATVAAFVSMGYTDIAGAAVAGNIMQETHYVPKYVNKMTKANHNPGMKGGLCQWQRERLTRLVTGNMEATNFIMSEQPMPCFGKQLLFIDRECKEVSTYKPTLNALKGATSDDKLAATTEKFRANYEGGSEPEKRINYAKEILKEYRKNPSSNQQTKIKGNEDKHISDIASGFLSALNQTAAASSTDVMIGIDSSKSKGDTIWLTNGRNTESFATVLDMIINTYPTKVDSVNWILPGDGTNYNLVPVAYLVTVKEGNSSIKMQVTSENNPTTRVNGPIPISKENETSGIHDSFCKALVKRYKSNTPELRSDTFEQFGGEQDYAVLFNEKRYEITKCNEVGNGNSNSESTESERENEQGYINDWNVGLYVQKLHYWQKNVCEELGKTREKRRTYKGCHMCTAAINRALRDSGLGRRYWGGEPWEVYDKMKSSGSRFYEVTGGTSSNKSEFNFGQKPQKGDVCVMWKVGRQRPRHTCSFDGSTWYSDVVQNMCNVYTGNAQFTIEWHLFRYK